MAKKNQHSSDDSSDGGGSLKRRKPVKDSRKKRKRKYSSSDSSSSEDSDSGSYSDSGSDSYSSSSGTSSSSDYRRKRRRKATTKDKYKNQKGKRDSGRGKRDKRHEGKSKRKSKWSSESSSDSKSKSTSDSSDSEKVGNKVVAPNRKSLVDKPNVSAEGLGGRKTSTPIASKETAVGEPKNDKMTITDGEGIHAKAGRENREAPTDKNNLEAKSDRSPIRNSRSDDTSSKLRLDMEAKSSPIKNLPGNAVHKASAPSEINKARNISRSPSPDGSQKRIRKGRGFTKEYSYARRYRTPSPDCSPAYSNRYRGRNDDRRDQDRYSRYRTFSRQSTPRYHRRSPRGSSPVRYNGRREKARSKSPNPVGYRSRMRDGSRSPRRSRSPSDEHPVMSERLRSRLGPQGSNRPSDKRRSRSRSQGSSTSKSADAGSPLKKGMRDQKSPSRSRSSSPDANNGLVSYPDVSPDTVQR